MLVVAGGQVTTARTFIRSPNSGQANPATEKSWSPIGPGVEGDPLVANGGLVTTTRSSSFIGRQVVTEPWPGSW